MSRYYSDSDDAYPNSYRRSGWQSPALNGTSLSPSAAPITRIIVDPPFGSKKCDYSIDKSRPGQLIVTARRRHTFTSDYLSTSNKNATAIQTFSLPPDADVDRLRSSVERHTNRLIIEVPRTPVATDPRPSYYGSSAAVVRDHEIRPASSMSGNQRKLEYRIDCRGYAADELEVFIHGHDLMVEGRTNRGASSDPTRQRMSKKFSRKITLPSTVDTSRVISYLDNGELRIEAPLKRHVSYGYDGMSVSRPASTVPYDRVRSPTHGNGGKHFYRRHERVSRHRNHHYDDAGYPPDNAMRRVRSAESLSYPVVSQLVPDVDVGAGGRRRTVNYERRVVNRNEMEQPAMYRSVYAPHEDTYFQF